MPSAREKKVTPSEYRSFIEGLELIRFRQIRGSFKLWDIDFFPSPTTDHLLKISNRSKIIPNENEHEKSFKVMHSYKIRVTAPESEKPSIEISAAFELEYSTDISITDDYWDIFRRSSLTLQSWPFLREYVNSIISRMGLPPLILPLLRL